MYLAHYNNGCVVGDVCTRGLVHLVDHDSMSHCILRLVEMLCFHLLYATMLMRVWLVVWPVKS